ncbi:class I poly(R)-hydroxyalkanoic acid synthase [Pseudoduganella umbonata]|uniref:Class I poly(R)-hydroxyalkanoic acid synthase n=1 Tax=Pseudoduganella umbonata TaxID=864828 RepID=A0A4P8HJL2_9BURK|nr:class I poly(R)-hydroxyalkanoic acid synthase [Pseudoduganella umbonata]MBB3219679.1 polyhydroxyalkanoate synthase [Pseudoduganella umbonata]QCP09737.1 class I poly(R)-hydroxyalkanoic acid synthase [Pseudoduganella umbonata]
MNMPDAQSLASWMDPAQWKSWMPNPDALANIPLPGAALLREAGATVRPEVLDTLKNEYMAEFGALWQQLLEGKTPEIRDRRFAAPAWTANPVTAFSAAAYLLNGKFLLAMADAVDASTQQKQKIRFAIQQVVDAMSPANFLATNPEAQQALLESKGESLTRGLKNMLADMQKGHISLSDDKAFEVGRNLATTEGDIVLETPLFQLIQYKPRTDTVKQRPLLMVPPCINKYYILDLQPANSLVRYAVEQGNTVFMVSWRNPDASLAKTSWDDYTEQGVIRAIRAVQEITQEDTLNLLGFCVGGTLLSTALAVLAARGEQPAASLTLLTTFLDFSDTGVLSVFIDEPQVKLREQALGQGGLMPGRDLASTFSSLRPNDLVWNYVQANYLKGNEPAPFDLLYWNSDSTNLPGPMFCWYLRNTYLENRLKEPGRLTVAGEQVDLTTIDAPAFIYGSREDHIVPWTSAYGSMNILNPARREANRFVLGASGHIAGVINPPSKNKRSYWVNEERPEDADGWMGGAVEHPGSWWPLWAAFLAEHGGEDIPARTEPGNAEYPPLEPAPGRYVKEKAD